MTINGLGEKTGNADLAEIGHCSKAVWDRHEYQFEEDL